MSKSYVSTEEAADYLGVSTSWLAKLRMKREGPAYFKLGARCVLYDLEELETWMRAHRIPERDDSPSGARPIARTR
jgi:excisionase family DNA binding protein